MSGAVNVLVDISERKRAEETAQRLASIVESSEDAIVSKTLDGIIMSWNSGAERLFGYAADEIIGKPIAILIPADRYDEEPGIIGRIRRGERIDHYETVRRRKDGSLVEISLTVSPVRDARGTIVGASKIARDITERRRAQELEKLLLDEMSHRVKNAFAVAAAVVSLSARSGGSSQELVEVVRGRLEALRNAHELTLRNPAVGGDKAEKPTTLLALARAITAPFADGDGRIVLSGPDVPTGGRSATSLALLLHELATNAAKHGALSSPAGRVDISWRIGEGALHLTWRERGGPPLDGEPRAEAFGSELVRGTVKSQLGGEISREWKADGLIVHLAVPLGRLIPSA